MSSTSPLIAVILLLCVSGLEANQHRPPARKASHPAAQHVALASSTSAFADAVTRPRLTPAGAPLSPVQVAAAAYASPFNRIAPSTLVGLAVSTATALRGAIVAAPGHGNGTHITLGPASTTSYTSFTNMRRDLTFLESNVCGSILEIIDFGHSAGGTPLFYARMSDNPNRREPNEIELLFIGGLGGDEPAGPELVFTLVKHLCRSYAVSSQIRNIINNFDFYFIISTNPDGLAKNKYTNNNGHDLSRDFPDPSSVEGGFNFDFPPAFDDADWQPETQAVARLLAQRRFVVANTMAAGGIVVAYPFDSNHAHYLGVASPTADDAAFRGVASAFAKVQPTMIAQPRFPGGTVNGAQWSPIFGTIADFHYAWYGALHVTSFLALERAPDYGKFVLMWIPFADAVLSQVLYVTDNAVCGAVFGAVDSHPLDAVVRVRRSAGTDWLHPVRSDPVTGEFCKIVTQPGSYEFVVSAAGHETVERTVPLPGGDLIFRLHN